MRLRPSSLFRDSLVCCEPVKWSPSPRMDVGVWRALSAGSSYLHLEVNKAPWALRRVRVPGATGTRLPWA